MELLDRLMRRIAVVGDCWIWQGSKDPKGYGRIWDGRRFQTHRVSYELHVGPIPDGLQLDHLCRTPSCVNPAHLEPVTPRENTLRGISPAALHAVQTHCQNGHEFTPENTYVRANGRRSCRTCKSTYDRLHPKSSRAKLKESK